MKEHLLVDGAIPQYGRMCKLSQFDVCITMLNHILDTQSIRSMKQYMLRQIPGYDMLMLPPYNTQKQTHKSTMDHLTCFVPGMLAMGAKTFNEPEDMEIAKGLLETCVFMYRTTKTGLSPENWVVSKTEAYNPLTFNKTKEELQSMRDWWYDGELQNPLIKKQSNETLDEESSGQIDKEQIIVKDEEEKQEYFVDYKLAPAKERPDSLFFGDERYILRPETVESLFILYRITGDQKYQVRNFVV